MGDYGKMADYGKMTDYVKLSDYGNMANYEKMTDYVKMAENEKMADYIKMADYEKMADSGKMADYVQMADYENMANSGKMADYVKMDDYLKMAESGKMGDYGKMANMDELNENLSDMLDMDTLAPNMHQMSNLDEEMIPNEPEPGMKGYKFEYMVNDKKTGDVKQHKESKSGKVVEGEYSLVQPDGKRRIVKYRATPHGGFKASVSYERTGIEIPQPMQMATHMSIPTPMVTSMFRPQIQNQGVLISQLLKKAPQQFTPSMEADEDSLKSLLAAMARRSMLKQRGW